MTPAEARDRFFGGFYRDPDPEVAALALLEFLRNPPPTAPRSGLMFIRAARLSAPVAEAMRDLAERAPEWGDDVRRLLAAAQDPAFPDPALIPLEGPDDLDFLWVELLLTGAAAPVQRVASVLALEDRTHAELSAWAARRPWAPWERAKHARVTADLVEAGFSLQAQPRPVIDQDLWLWRLMGQGFQARERLPFPLDDATVQHLMLKGAACWSLQSNARQHPVVRAVYEALPERARFPRFVPDGS